MANVLTIVAFPEAYWQNLNVSSHAVYILWSGLSIIYNFAKQIISAEVSYIWSIVQAAHFIPPPWSQTTQI